MSSRRLLVGYNSSVSTALLLELEVTADLRRIAGLHRVSGADGAVADRVLSLGPGRQ